MADNPTLEMEAPAPAPVKRKGVKRRMFLIGGVAGVFRVVPVQLRHEVPASFRGSGRDEPRARDLIALRASEAD